MFIVHFCVRPGVVGACASFVLTSGSGPAVHEHTNGAAGSAIRVFVDGIRRVFVDGPLAE